MERTINGNGNRAVIFDLDGTLLNTLEDLTDAFNTTCGHYGCRRYFAEEYRMLIGNGSKQVVAALFARHRVPASQIDDGVRRFKQAYLATRLAKTFPYPGIAEMLQKLLQKKIALNVLSNKPHQETERCMRRFFQVEKFKVIQGHQEHKPLKPDPTTAYEILNLCRVPPDKALFIGDTAVDIETARNVGMPSVGVTWGFRSRHELEACGADTIVDHPCEIVKLFS